MIPAARAPMRRGPAGSTPCSARRRAWSTPQRERAGGGSLSSLPLRPLARQASRLRRRAPSRGL